MTGSFFCCTPIDEKTVQLIWLLFFFINSKFKMEIELEFIDIGWCVNLSHKNNNKNVWYWHGYITVFPWIGNFLVIGLVKIFDS